MRLFLITFIVAFCTLGAYANDAVTVIEQDGVLRFTDGSSIYVFHQDGRFELRPTGMSGRTINGTWESDDGILQVEGEWSWINGISQPNDIRIMRLQVSPRDEYETVNNGKDQLRKVYFTIDSIVEKEAA